MNFEIVVSEASLREDVLGAIETVEAARALDGPSPALECLRIELSFAGAILVFPADAGTLNALALALSSWWDGRRKLPAATAPELASAIVSLDPEAVTWGYHGWPPGAVISQIISRIPGDKRGWIFKVQNEGVCVRVRGTDKAVAELKIKWLLGERGLPSGATEAGGA